MIDLGSLKNLAQFAKCPIFSQKSIHPTGPDAMVYYCQVRLAFGHIWLKNQVFTDRVGIHVATNQIIFGTVHKTLS